MKRYEKYKNTGVEWIGQIPLNWDIKSIKYISDIYNGSTPKDEDRFWDGDIKWLTPSDLGRNNGNKYINDSRRSITQLGLNSCGCNLISANSIILSTRAPIGHVAIPNFKYATNQGCKSLVPINFSSDYLYYFLLTARTELENLGSGSTFMELSSQTLANFKIPIPTGKEQLLIALYLDNRTSLIDDLISKKQCKIDLLKEQHTAIINQAITKGLNPNAKMKDSGVEYLGEIPEHWIIKKLKFSTYMKGRIGWQGLKQEEFTDEGPFLITGMNFKDGVIRWNEVYHISQERYDEAPEIQLREGDVLMTKDGTIGKLLFIESLPGPTSLNSHLLVLRPLDDTYIPKFLYYQLDTLAFKNHVELVKTGTTFYGITQEEVGNYPMIVPPLSEQQEIIEFISKEHFSITNLFNLEEKKIALLQELRQSLISEVVTGKIDVRDWQRNSNNN